MNGVGNDETGVLVLGATNMWVDTKRECALSWLNASSICSPWALDPAIKRRFEKRIYIPLPDVEARKRMYELNVGTTPCNLGPKEYRQLAEQTEGYTGSDIAVLVRDAIMQPIRKVLGATHFKKVIAPVKAKDDAKDDEIAEPGKTKEYWTPCSPGDADAVERTWTDIESEDLLEVSADGSSSRL